MSLHLRHLQVFFLIFALTFLSCDKKTGTKEIASSDSTSSIDTTPSQSKFFEPDEHPYTYNPTILRLENNWLYVDSLRPYFRYRDVERLDFLCKKLTIDRDDSLCTIFFLDKKIKLKYKLDPFHLAEHQFLVGNLKKLQGQPDILIFLNYIEGWGKELFLVSVDENHEIIDMQTFCYYCGDGGDFSTMELKHQDIFNYFSIKKVGFQKFSTPIDTITYDKTIGKLTINNNRFEYRTLKIDSNIMELIPRRE
ncbi:hypothetical protein [Haliscomenobacter hydrossis]|uniref:Lipoprotein n=1 Tax=Haliscomenobacter hydrossis (strain ATCC 27775 / DSM 1100 / LMG 10767 / O) TaxID=760192 RepID=F4L765_HALH1|nr:hypothetical protein [Haliscomenobacter hydrossis]AEE52141.1 hypothetical protein Halhy_4297 [Haliscomenobacter hydrossis DSM 1100]